MRKATDESCFPYAAKTTCYIEVSADGSVGQVSCTKNDMTEAVARAKAGQSKLYAVWPGNYRSDLFIIDDLDMLADAYGIDHGNKHQHIVDYRMSDHDDGISRYASVNLVFDCGCEIDFNNIKAVANDLKAQFGWDMAASTGFGYHVVDGKPVYSVSIRRSSLNKKP